MPVFDCTAHFQQVGKKPVKPLPSMDTFFVQSGQNNDPQMPDEVNVGSFVAVAHTINSFRKSENTQPGLSLNLHAVYVLLDSAK